MASDRNAKLSIETDASSMAKAAEDAKKLETAIGKVGEAGADASGDLKKAADSLERVETAEQDVTGRSQQAANALEEVGQAALDSSQAAVEGASRTSEAVEATSAGVREWPGIWGAAGEAASQAAAEAKGGVDAVTAAEEAAAAGARELGQATEQAADEAEGFKEGVQQIEKMADAIRESGMALGDQRQAIGAALSELEKLIAAENTAGRAGQETANLASTAAETFRRKLIEVNAEIEREKAQLQGLGDAGESAFSEIGDAAFNVDATTTAAAKHIEGAWEQLNDNFAVTPRQLSLISQAVAATEIAIVRAGERGQAVTIDQLALYEKQKASLVELTGIANRLTNSAKDNAIGLKQTGAQIAGVAAGVAQLSSMLGPNASKIGLVVGNVGQLGSVMESLQSQVKTLDVNTVSLSGSAAKLGVQIGAMLAVFTAASAAGVKLAETNSQNAESMDDLWQAIKKLASGEIEKVKGQIGGLQTGLQDLLIASNAKEFAHALAEVAIASGRGADGVKLYNVALRDGLTAQQAMRVAATNTAQTLKFYEDSLRGGAEGHEIWMRALRESAGDADRMAAFIRANNEALQKSIAITTAQTEAQKQNNAANREGIDIARLKADTTTRLLTAEEQNIARLSVANRQLEQAQNGTTASLNQGLAAIRSMIGDSARNSEELADMAGALSEVLANTSDLTAKERERHATVIELALRGNELTISERAYGAALAQSIINGDKSVGTLAAQETAALSLKTAIDALVEATQAEVSANEDKDTAIQKAVKAAEKLLASTTPLTAAERERLRTIVELGRQVDELAAQQERLAQATNATTAAQTDATASETQMFVAKSGKVDWLQREIDVRAEIIKSLATEKTSTDDLASSTQAIIKIQEDGRTVYTNLTEDQNKAAAATKATGDAAEKAAGQFGDVLVRRLADGRVVISQVGETAGETADNLSRIGNRAAESGPAVAGAFEKWKGGVGNVDDVIDKMRILEALFVSLEERPLRIAKNVGVMGKALEAAGDSATKASGYASGKVQETG